MPNVPYVPSFPVFGMPNCESRWIDMWNFVPGDDDRIWHVDLGHGDPRGTRLVVISDSKFSAVATSAGVRIGPSGVDDAARRAVLSLLGSADEVVLEREMRASQDRVESGWHAESVIVSGVEVVFEVRRLSAGFAAVSDLGEVAVGLCGVNISLHEI